MNVSISDLSQLAAVDVDPDGVARQEEVVGVVVQLGALVLVEGVLDRQLVQAELGRQLVQLVGRRAAQVDPHDRVLLSSSSETSATSKSSASSLPSR